MRLRTLRAGVLLVALAACITLRPLTFSQTSSSSSDSEDAAHSQHNSPANASHNSEEGEDENAQFKQSASVKLLARVTGLSLDGAYWLAVIINFAIVAGVIAWALKKNLPAMFRNRTTSIQRAIEEARRASEDANQRLAQIESRLGRLDEEIAQMRVTSEKEAAAEEQRIQKAAEEDAKRIVESAEQEIASAAKAARRELTSYAADLAVTLATKQIHVDTSTDQALVRRFATELAKNGNKA